MFYEIMYSESDLIDQHNCQFWKTLTLFVKQLPSALTLDNIYILHLLHIYIYFI